MRIFFSHSSRDKALLRELRAYFPPWLTAWIDEEELRWGADLELSLRQAIDEQVDYVVLFVGLEAIESEWVKREVAWSLQREQQLGRVFLLPVLLVDVRDRLDELGLAGRLTLQIADFSRAGTKLLAENLIDHLSQWLSQSWSADQTVIPRKKPARDIDSFVLEALAGVPDPWRQEVDALLTLPFLENVTASKIGHIPLTAEQYYQRILGEMGRACMGWRIHAVSTLTSMLWSEDSEQSMYAASNIAAATRGADISRLFLVPLGAVRNFRVTIAAQEAVGIRVRVGSNRVLAHVPQLEDCVIFEAPDGTRAYIAHPTIDGSRRVRSGFLDVSPGSQSRLSGAFWEAWELGSLIDSYAEPETRAIATATSRRAPGLMMLPRFLATPVISCEEAAAARDIPLERELKTLILKTQNGFVAAHLPGDGVLSLRKVKDRLELAEAYLADPEDLLNMGLSAGTVCAVLEPVWGLPHLVSRRVLDMHEVMTNNGTRTGYFAFDPAVLVEAKDVIVAELEK